MPAKSVRAVGRDPTVYPVEERVGEDILQRWIVELFRPLVDGWLREQGIKAFVGADQFIYYMQFDIRKRVAPDTYVLPGVDPLTHVPSWKVFETGIRPNFALEVVSSDWEKDYTEAPVLYAELGVTELVVFDPEYESGPYRYRFQVFRRASKRGFLRVEVTNDDRVKSKVLGCFVRSVGHDRLLRLRLATGSSGEVLVPTPEEREQRERAEKERALARIAELEREIAEFRREKRPRRRSRKRR